MIITPSRDWVPMLLMTSYFVVIVSHWFVEIYAKEFATRDYHLVLEVITLIVRNIVEGVRFIVYHNGLFCPCCGMTLRLTPTSRECKEIHKRKASRIETIA